MRTKPLIIAENTWNLQAFLNYVISKGYLFQVGLKNKPDWLIHSLYRKFEKENA